MKKILLGNTDLKSFIETGGYYIDKSLILKDVIDDANNVILLPRPRRFGKTLNQSLLKYFFEKPAEKNESNANLFKDLKIAKTKLFNEHFEKYPVIYLSFKDIKNMKYDVSYKLICIEIANEFERVCIDYKNNDTLTDNEKNYITKIINRKGAEEDYLQSIKSLTKILNKMHNTNVVILIDEYDTPIHAAYQYGYHDEMIAFMRGLFSAGLKDNTYLFKSVVTGILRVSKESIFSGMNNLSVHSVLSNDFSDKFGITEPELKDLLKYYNMLAQFEKIQDWYDGYKFGETKIYNPWSVLNYLCSNGHIFKPYWVNTASNDLLKDLIRDGDILLREDIKYLLEGKELIERELNDNIAFGDLRYERNNAISFLYFTGHLTYSKKIFENDTFKYNLKVPNKEVAKVYEDIIQNWLNESYTSNGLNIMLKSLIYGEIDIFEEKLNEFVLETLSYFDSAKKNVEAVYQAFILGTFLNLRDKYRIKSNIESGLGRYDICLIPNDKTKAGIIIELKKKLKKYKVDKVLNDALQQIEEKKYDTELISAGIKKIEKIAVTFDGKRCWIKQAKKNYLI